MRLICSLRCRSPICRTIIGKKYRSVWVDIPSVLYDPPITAVEELAMLDDLPQPTHGERSVGLSLDAASAMTEFRPFCASFGCEAPHT
jgi:hypothetical protein